MHAIEYLRDPSALPARPIYTVFGDDAFLRRETLTTIVRHALAGDDEGRNARDIGLVKLTSEDLRVTTVLKSVTK